MARKKKRKLPPAQVGRYKYFGPERFTHHHSTDTKPLAQKAANKLRKRGVKARVTKTKGMKVRPWNVWKGSRRKR